MRKLIIGLLILVFIILPVGVVLASTLYENNITGDDSDELIYGDNWSAQPFKVGTSHTVDSVELEMWKGGSPGTLTVSIRNSAYSGGAWRPAGGDLTAGTVNASLFGASPGSWETINLTPEYSLDDSGRYSVVVRAVAGDATNNVSWRYNSTGGYGYGIKHNSTNAGVSWDTSAGEDFMFKVYGGDVLDVTNVEVYSSQVEDGDWLVVFLYKNIYPPYYQYENPTHYFNLQLLGTNKSDLIAQGKLPSWGYKPGHIYIAHDTAVNLTWGDNYTVRMEGTPAKFTVPYPYDEYELVPVDYVGSETFWLGEWVITSAQVIESYYNVNLTMDSLGNETLPYTILNSLGCEIYMQGIPGIEELVPERFYEVSWSPEYTEEGYTNKYQDSLTWINQTSTEGATGQIPAALTEAGGLFNLDGKAIGWILMFILYIAVVGIGVRAIDNVPVAVALGVPVLLLGGWLGFIPLVFLAILTALNVMAVIFIIILRGT